MNDQVLAAGLMLVNTLLQKAMEISGRIQAGTLDQAFLDSLDTRDAEARQRQIDALNKAESVG